MITNSPADFGSGDLPAQTAPRVALNRAQQQPDPDPAATDRAACLEHAPGPARPLQVSSPEPYPWEAPLRFPVGGLSRRAWAPLVEEAYFQGVAGHAWAALGAHWEGQPPAFQELRGLAREGCIALARFMAGHFLRSVPEPGLSAEAFWEEFWIFNLRTCHDMEEGDEFRAYLRWRVGQPQPAPFLERVVQALAAKETPDLGSRMLFCIWWDLFFLPLRFWLDEAAADVLRASGAAFNLDKVRNTRRELGLKRVHPIIVRRFQSRPSRSPGGPECFDVEFSEDAAQRAGLSAMLAAFAAYLDNSGVPKS